MQPNHGATHEHHRHAHAGQHVMPDGTVMDGAHHDHSLHAHAAAVGKAARQGDPDQAEYTCPMHPQVRQMGPGNCPICGMALEPVLATAEHRREPRTAGHDAALLDRHRPDGCRSSRWRWAATCSNLQPPGQPADVELDSACCWARRWCCGRAGRSSCAPWRR